MTSIPARRRPTVVWVIAGVVWLAVVIGGLAALMQYDNSPGVVANAPATWPLQSTLSRDAHGPTLVMLAHPRCDCTGASLSELSELLARAPQRPRTYVVFIRPGRVPGGWEQTSLWRRATEIPGVTVVRDEGGAEASLFGVETSGQALLYDAGGRLMYHGGTTGSRGKTGANTGRAAILAALAGRPALAMAPVFGCSLFGPGDAVVERADQAHEPFSR